MFNFLKDQDPELAKEYQKERFLSGETGVGYNYRQPTETIVVENNVGKMELTESEKFLGHMTSMDDLSNDHFCKQYVAGRQIPTSYYKDLYFTEDFKDTAYKFKYDGYENVPPKPRLVIPFLDTDGNIIALQGRALDNDKLRYITLKANDDCDKIYGLHNIKFDRKIHVFEGPFDSMFIDNSLAQAGSSTEISQYLPDDYKKSDVVFVFDNERRSKNICAEMQKRAVQGYSVCLWGDNIVSKDVNEMITDDGLTVEQIKQHIDDNSYGGLKFSLMFKNWRKC
jgi:hypothetical protein